MEMSMRIQNDSEHEVALRRTEQIFFASPNTPLGEELDALVDAIEKYEEIRFPIEVQWELGSLSSSKRALKKP